MVQFEENAAKVMEEVCESEHGGCQEWLQANQPLFSFDNDPVHNAADAIIPPTYRVPLPPRSPDMHKVIEHSYNWLTHTLKKGLLPCCSIINRQRPFSLAFWPKLVEGVYLSLPVEGVRKDVMSLPDTYLWIANNEGKRAPRHLS